MESFRTREENISPDQDYVELGSLYQTLAERSTSDEEKRRYRELAIEQWENALRVPGLLKSRKDGIKLLRDVMSSRLKGNSGGFEIDSMTSSLRSTRTLRGGTDERSVASQSEDSQKESS